MIPVMILAIENDDDRDFMIRLYSELYPLMNSIAYDIVKSKETAEDMVHDSIAKLIEKIDTIRPMEKRRLASYVAVTVTNTSINHYNKEKGPHGASYYGIESALDNLEEMPTISAEEEFAIKEKYRELGEAIRKLPERDRVLLYLKYNLEMEDAAIAGVIGIGKDSVRQYLTRARRAAKQYISRDGDES